jgi:predicted phosphohydrolase
VGLYAIGDLHLHFQTPLQAKAQRTERVWRDHEEKLRRNCAAMLTPEDTLVLAGDHSWGRDLNECAEDFAYIEALPGRKILLRGNHDMFWDAAKTEQLNQHFGGSLQFVQNSYAVYQDYALVGTKGFSFEGPFFLNSRGRIVGWDEDARAHAEKIIERELGRLRASFETAKAAGFRKYLMFLHYPPTSILEESSGFTDMAEEYGAEQVIYAHCHGESRFHDSLEGTHNGVRYQLVSGDYLRWTPVRIFTPGES